MNVVLSQLKKASLFFLPLLLMLATVSMGQGYRYYKVTINEQQDNYLKITELAFFQDETSFPDLGSDFEVTSNYGDLSYLFDGKKIAEADHPDYDGAKNTGINLNAGDPLVITVDLGVDQSVAMDQLAIYTANPDGKGPSAFTVEASNDASDWTEILNRSSQAAYKSSSTYRLFTKNNGQEANTVFVNAINTANGKFNNAGYHEVQIGEDLALNFTADQGYKAKGFVVGTAVHLANDSHIFTLENITEAVEVQGIYILDQPEEQDGNFRYFRLVALENQSGTDQFFRLGNLHYDFNDTQYPNPPITQGERFDRVWNSYTSTHKWNGWELYNGVQYRGNWDMKPDITHVSTVDLGEGVSIMPESVTMLAGPVSDKGLKHFKIQGSDDNLFFYDLLEVYDALSWENDEVYTYPIDNKQKMLTASAGDHGQIAPSGSMTVMEGFAKTFSITPAEGFRISAILVNDQEQPFEAGITKFSVENITEDTDFKVLFEAIPTYNITPVVTGMGNVTPAETVTVLEGGSASFSYTAEDGYALYQILLNGETVTDPANPFVLEDIMADAQVTFEFKAQFDLTITASEGVNINPEAKVYTLFEGMSKTFTFSEMEGYQITEVWVDGLPVEHTGTHTFDMVMADGSLTVNAKKEYTISAAADEHGTITPAGDIIVLAGDQQTFAFEANEGFVIDQVLINGEPMDVSEEYTFNNVMADQSIEVTTKPVYTITVSSGDNGSVSEEGAVMVVQHENKTFTFTPSMGYKVSEVLVDGIAMAVGDSYTFEDVMADHTLEVSFEMITYTINVSSGDNGSVSEEGAVVVDYGTSKTFTFTPSEGYKVSEVLVDGSTMAVSESYTFEDVMADHTLEVSFEMITYTISVTSDDNGSVSEEGAVVVDYGTSKTFTFTPSEGYKVSEVLVDGSTMAVSESYTFEDVMADHTLEVKFEIEKILNADNAHQITIYPNPSIGQAITVQLNQPHTLDIISLQGQLIKSLPASSLFNNLLLPAGTYLFRFQAEGTLQTKKVVIY